MHFVITLILVFSAVRAQVPLPDTLYLPPPPAAGAVPSNSTTSPNPQWTNLLGNLIYFYEAQRSGNLSKARVKRVQWRNDSALDDGKDVGLDLSGGYYDAGDYIKSTFPLSFTLMSICWGALDFGQGYDIANQTAYLDDMLRWGLDWLMKAHPQRDVLYVQVADSQVDNNYWGGDLAIPGPRPSFQINSTNPGTDAAAGASAAFAACSALYANHTLSSPSANPSYTSASLNDSSYAFTLLSHAQELYNFAQNASGGQKVYQSSVPAVADAYPSSAYTDELVIAALFLALALGDNDRGKALYDDASRMYDRYSMGNGLVDKVMNWDEKTPGIPVLSAQVGGAWGDSNVARWKIEAEKYFDSFVNGTGRGHLTRGGLLYYNGDSDEASLNPALNAAMLLTRYAPIASSTEKGNTYLKFAQRQVDYVLGNNPMSVPYIVGSNPNSPSNPHSALASGNVPLSNSDTISHGNLTYTIFGALIGGPDSHDKYYDIRRDWPQTEVALDYNAPMLTLAVMHLALSSATNAGALSLPGTEDPYYTQLPDGAYAKVRPKGTPCDAAFRCSRGMRRNTTIAVVVVVTVVGLITIGLSVWYGWLLFTKRK